MKKSIILLVSITLLFYNSFSQNYNSEKLISPNQGPRLLTNFQSAANGKVTKHKFNNKALGDTLHYESFTDSLPAGYTIVNLGQNIPWKWDSLNRVSFPPTTIPRIKSTTGSSGYMSLPLGSSGPSADTYFESDKITISPRASVLLQYQIYIATCCSSNDIVSLEVSIDSLNWDSYDISFPNNIANADTSTAVTLESLNLSPTLGNQTEFWYRVYVSGPSAYFIMLDDFAFVEGACNDLVLSNTYLEFNNTNYNYNPAYSQIPHCFFPALPFSGTIKAEGGCDQTGVGFDIEVTHLNTPSGSPATGMGSVYTSLTTIGNLLTMTDTNVISGSPKFTPNIIGDYEVEFNVSSDSSDQIPSNNIDKQTFSVSDTVFAKDNNNFDGGIGPASYVDGGTGTPGGTAAGDRFGTMYILENVTGNGSNNIPTSITYYVSDNPDNIGVGIVPKIWGYNEDSLFNGTIFNVNSAFGNEVASSFLTYTVTSSDTNSFLTLPLTNGSALVNGLDSGQYIVGWEVSVLPSGSTFEVANDISIVSSKQPSFTTFLYFGHATSAGWQSVIANPAIRLNMGNLGYLSTGRCLTTSFSESNVSSSAQFEVSPNPSNGEFKLNITTEQSTAYNLNVRNMLGQTVYTGLIRVNGPTTERLDLSGLEKGVYFVTLENESEKLLKKVVLK